MGNSIKNACVIGAGAYGSALSEVFAENIDITMLSLSYETMESINTSHMHPKCLCNIKFKNNILCRCDYECCKKADAIFIVTPVSAVRVVCQNIIQQGINNDVPVIMCSKGIDIASGSLTTEIAKEVGLKNDVFVLSGPSFAEDIAAGLCAAVSLAGTNAAVLSVLQNAFSTPNFKIVSNNDPTGTQICGAMKNVLAVLCGAFIGAGLGKSAVAMLITASINEIGELVVKAGGNKQTVYEVCGVGDIILTCTNEMSRNMRFGKFMGSGEVLENWNGDLAEGAFTAKAMPIIQKRFMPLNILSNAYDMIYCGKSVKKVVDDIVKII